MTKRSPDPLLTCARLLLGLLIGLVSIAGVLVAIGVVAVLTVQRAEIVADVAAAELPAAAYWGVVAGLVGVALVLFLGLRFLLELRVIVTSVDHGDPFIAENAQRLARMGWLALWMQLLLLPLGIATEQLGELTDGGSDLRASSAGLLLALTLFVLARVFRIGAEMRADLEGTV